MCCAVASWPGLAIILVKSIDKEVGAVGRKKGPDSTVSKTFKHFVQTADDERRSGAQHIASSPHYFQPLAYQQLLLPGYAKDPT